VPSSHLQEMRQDHLGRLRPARHASTGRRPDSSALRRTRKRPGRQRFMAEQATRSRLSHSRTGLPDGGGQPSVWLGLRAGPQVRDRARSSPYRVPHRRRTVAVGPDFCPRGWHDGFRAERDNGVRAKVRFGRGQRPCRENPRPAAPPIQGVARQPGVPSLTCRPSLVGLLLAPPDRFQTPIERMTREAPSHRNG
jgi:hypothetical protein